MKRPLAGVRVLDLSIVVQGPQCSAMLADFGADVVKIERPEVGDPVRHLPISLRDRRSAFFYAHNRGKRSVTLDVSRPEGREVVLRLLEKTDVMLSSFRPGVMERLGLGYDVCAERNARLVYATASAFGPEGPAAARAGVDLAAQAMGGLISTIGEEGDFPSPVGAVIADSIGGLTVCVGILTALFVRERTGRGQRVDGSLLGGQIWAQAGELSFYLLGGAQVGRANRGHGGLLLPYRVLRTRDGHVALAGVGDREWPGFLRAIERPELAEDPRFADGEARVLHLKELNAILDQAFATRTTAEWCARLGAENQRFAPVNDHAAVAADDQARANGYIVETNHPVWGPTLAVGNPVRFSETPAQFSAWAPELGQHTEEVLLEAGYTWEEIARLRESRVL